MEKATNEAGPCRETAIEAIRSRAEMLRERGRDMVRRADQLIALAKQLQAINRHALASAAEGQEAGPHIGVGSDAEAALWHLAMSIGRDG